MLVLCGASAKPKDEIKIQINPIESRVRLLKRAFKGLTTKVPTTSTKELGISVIPPSNAVVPSNPCAHIGK
jgi:hypothetical protein